MGEKPLGQRPVLGDQPRLASRLPYRFDAAITAALTPPSTKDVAVFYYTHSYDSNLGHQDIPYLNRNKIPILATIAVGSIILVGGVTLCLVTAAGFCTAIAPGEEATGQAATTLFPGLGDIPTGAETASAAGSEGAAASSMTNATGLARQLAGEEASSIFTESGGLQPSVIQSSHEIISGSELGNPEVIKSLTSNGSNIADWGKYTTPSFESPSGPFQVHFYYNSVTGAVHYGIDYKAVFNNGIQPW